VHGRDTAALARVCEEIADAGGLCHPVAGELTDPDQLARVVQDAEDGFGDIDVLVANAGGSPSRPQPVEEMSDEDFLAAVDLNLVTTFRLVKAVLPGMKDRGRGSIITISSAAARRPSAHSPIAYAAAKAGVELLTKDVALQVGPFGVRANCVAPGTIITEGTGERIPREIGWGSGHHARRAPHRFSTRTGRRRGWGPPPQRPSGSRAAATGAHRSIVPGCGVGRIRGRHAPTGGVKTRVANAPESGR
jgi:3-oxoacyl-[acyl-carrier protein] reductase